MKHPKKAAAAVGLAAILPFILGVDGSDVVTFGDPAFWAVVAKALGAAAGAALTAIAYALLAGGGAFAAAVGKRLGFIGKKKLEDNDPSNDFVGELQAAAGDGLVALGEKLDPPSRPSRVIPLLPAPPASSPPDPSKPPQSAA